MSDLYTGDAKEIGLQNSLANNGKRNARSLFLAGSESTAASTLAAPGNRNECTPVGERREVSGSEWWKMAGIVNKTHYTHACARGAGACICLHVSSIGMFRLTCVLLLVEVRGLPGKVAASEGSKAYQGFGHLTCPSGVGISYHFKNMLLCRTTFT